MSNVTLYQTGYSSENVVQAFSAIRNALLEPASLTINTGISLGIDTGEKYKNTNPFPVVFIVTGAGRNGKDTVIDTIGKYCSVCNLSSITEVKDIAAQLIRYTQDLEYRMPVSGSKSQNEKTDSYRTFLNDIKTAWSKFNDGPNYNLLQQVSEIIRLQYADACRYDAIFLHIREWDEINKMADLIMRTLKLPVITMIVKGLVSPIEYTNPGDADAENHTYNLEFYNTPNKKAMMEAQAMLFAENLIAANKLYGLECTPSDPSTTGYIDPVIKAEEPVDTVTVSSDCEVKVSSDSVKTAIDLSKEVANNLKNGRLQAGTSIYDTLKEKVESEAKEFANTADTIGKSVDAFKEQLNGKLNEFAEDQK